MSVIRSSEHFPMRALQLSGIVRQSNLHSLFFQAFGYEVNVIVLTVEEKSKSIKCEKHILKAITV